MHGGGEELVIDDLLRAMRRMHAMCDRLGEYIEITKDGVVLAICVPPGENWVRRFLAAKKRNKEMRRVPDFREKSWLQLSGFRRRPRKCPDIAGRFYRMRRKVL